MPPVIDVNDDGWPDLLRPEDRAGGIWRRSSTTCTTAYCSSRTALVWATYGDVQASL